MRLEHDLDRNSLDDFGEIARRIVRRQQGELLPARRGDAVNMTFEPRTRKRVDLDRHGLPSRPGEFHPEPLTDPDLTLSRHPARAIA